MSDREIAELAIEALYLAVGGDHKGAARNLARLIRNADTDQMFALCLGFAEGAHKALLKAAGDRAPDLAKGEHWGIEQVRIGSDDPAVLFSLRFIVACCNGDRDMCRTHYDVMLTASEDARLRGVAQLFGDAAKLIREATAPVGGEDG